MALSLYFVGLIVFVTGLGWLLTALGVGTAIVNTLRNLYADQPLGTDVWTAMAWCVGLLIGAYALAVRTYHRRLA